MADAVEEVRIAEGDVARASADLGANVGQHDVNRHHAKTAVVYRHDRTVTAPMLAPAARLRVRHCSPLVADLETRVPAERRKPCAIGHAERDARHFDALT